MPPTDRHQKKPPGHDSRTPRPTRAKNNWVTKLAKQTEKSNAGNTAQATADIETKPDPNSKTAPQRTDTPKAQQADNQNMTGNHKNTKKAPPLAKTNTLRPQHANRTRTNSQQTLENKKNQSQNPQESKKVRARGAETEQGTPQDNPKAKIYNPNVSHAKRAAIKNRQQNDPRKSKAKEINQANKKIEKPLLKEQPRKVHGTRDEPKQQR
ncbi:hypothetical protein SK79_01212 [Escherichia coli]|nr:hypothetical protein SK79_01212 [Escherichia coli]